MTKKKPPELKELIHSKKLVIKDRFFLQVSMLDTGAFKKSYLIIINDMLEKNFKMQYFSNDEEATMFLKMLQEI